MNSKFIKIRCKKCKNEQIVFEKSSTVVNCLVCNEKISEPSGGKSKINSNILEVIDS
jgi:small subunit ribosomal protein S27e